MHSKSISFGSLSFFLRLRFPFWFCRSYASFHASFNQQLFVYLSFHFFFLCNMPPAFNKNKKKKKIIKKHVARKSSVNNSIVPSLKSLGICILSLVFQFKFRVQYDIRVDQQIQHKIGFNLSYCNSNCTGNLRRLQVCFKIIDII